MALRFAGSLLSGKIVPGAILSDSTRLHYRCNGSDVVVSTENGILFLHFVDSFLSRSGITSSVGFASRDGGPYKLDIAYGLLMLLSLENMMVALVLYAAGCKSHDQGSSLKPHVTGNLIHDWWFGIQLNPQFMGVDLKFFFVRAGMLGWLLINLSVLAKNIQEGSFSRSMVLYQLFCVFYILDYFFYEEYMTTTWDIIAERLGFMLVFGDLVWIPFTFSIQAYSSSGAEKPYSYLSVKRFFSVGNPLAGIREGWWLLRNKVELTTAAAIANCLIFMIGYKVFRGANKQKHVFKKSPKAPIWGKPPKVIGGKLLASGYWGVARHCNYLGDLLLALSFSLPCGASSPVPYFYPIYLLILLIWRERRDEARCAEKYKEVWAEYCKLVPWRILPYVY
ncbi:hypothetical protein HHK36_016741 [Tetracentron sinense]|uniref:Delta(14)-sterol reductase n=1 Tax=Tetracentron sinense TaxID=13715 RepID=A0A835DEI5_TETSI|nr:hypothetical protein HHK36_016741 [Tetracentron sinense]